MPFEILARYKFATFKQMQAYVVQIYGIPDSCYRMAPTGHLRIRGVLLA
jgi:hypothetical protein